MLKVFLSFLLFGIVCFDATADNLKIGERIPLIRLTATDGVSEIHVGMKSDKVYLLNFWATWCAPCKEEMPLLDAYYQKHKSEGLEVIAINMDDSRKLHEAHAFANQFSFIKVDKKDTEIKGLGRLWRLPSTFVVDKDGLLRKDGNKGDAVVTVEELDQILLPLLSKQ